MLLLPRAPILVVTRSQSEDDAPLLHHLTGHDAKPGGRFFRDRSPTMKRNRFVRPALTGAAALLFTSILGAWDGGSPAAGASGDQPQFTAIAVSAPTRLKGTLPAVPPLECDPDGSCW